MRRTVVVGLGNPLRSDDGVGPAVARELRATLGSRGDVEVRELHSGGLALMEACAGYDRAIIVDAMTAGERPGTIYRTTAAELGDARTCACAHDTTLAAALEVGRFLQVALPPSIQVWGVEPADVTTCGEVLTGTVADAVPIVVSEIVAALATGETDGRAL